MNPTKDFDVPPPSGRPLQRDWRHTDTQNPPYTVESLLPEERELFKKCIYGTILTNGVPFAVVLHYLSKYAQSKATSQIVPKHFLMRTFTFFGNVIFGSLIFSPLCVHKLRVIHDENKKNRQELSNTSFPAVEKVSTSSESEDFSYPTDLMSSLNEPESNFSSDFNPSNLLNNEEDKKLLSTTYEDLRNQHRSSISKSDRNPPSHLNIERQDELDVLSTPIKSSTFNEPPRRITKRNKYGDEME